MLPHRLSLVLLLSAVSIQASAAPNVLFLSVDTLRADYLGCYGNPSNSSPFIDTLAGQSLLFEDCLCETPLTNPSFGAMLSSLYPRMTGTSRNGLKMPQTVPLIQELFQAAGYQTMCVQSNWTLKTHLSGLGRGFDVYEDDFHEKRWGIIKPERGGRNVTDRALELLAARDTAKPFFFWVHYSDPHAPYQYHRDLNRTGKQLWRLNLRDRIRVKYDTEVAYTDAQIARFMQAVPPDTVVLFVADHGESLYEHGYLGHGRRIYQTNLHVPLFIRAPGVAPSRTNAPACTIDVGPTLLGLAGIAPHPGMLGCDLLKNPPPENRMRFLETYGGAVPKLPGAKLLMGGSGPMRSGLVHDGWKLILGSGPELYNLAEDPMELANLAGKHPGRVTEFKKLIEGWQKEHPKGQTQVVPMSEDDRRALQSLGYFE